MEQVEEHNGDQDLGNRSWKHREARCKSEILFDVKCKISSLHAKNTHVGPMQIYTFTDKVDKKIVGTIDLHLT